MLTRAVCGDASYFLRRQVWIPDRQDVWRLARLGRLTKEYATVSIPGICDESFEVPRANTRAWDPSHSLYLEVREYYDGDSQAFEMRGGGWRAAGREWGGPAFVVRGGRERQGQERPG